MLGSTNYAAVEELRNTTEKIANRCSSPLKRLLNGFARHRLARRVSKLDQVGSAVPERARDMANGFA